MLPLLLSLLLQDPNAPPAQPGVAAAFQEWKGQHGGNWILQFNPATGTGQFLYGGSMEAPFAAHTDADYAELGRVALQQAFGMFGIDDSTLTLKEVHHLALSQIGTTDKVAVEYSQQVHGVPVVGGSATVLCAPGGKVLAIDTTGLPEVERLSTRPGVDPRAAITAAEVAYGQLEGLAPTSVGDPTLVIYPYKPGKVLIARLAWSIELRTPVAGGLPSGRRMYVAADDGLQVLGNDQLVHRCGSAPARGEASLGSSEDALFGPNDLTGHVDSWTTPGLNPDTTSNPETLQAMRALRVTSSVGNATTDASGNFTIPNSGTTPVNLTFSYFGTWANVQNVAGSEYSLTQSYTPGVFQSVAMNPTKVEQITAQSNAFQCVYVFRDYLKSIDPNENSMDFQVLANVNISSTCNAYYDGGSINFYLSGGGCVNTAYSTVCAHEEGHWANDREGSGNGSDGFGEGNADNYAMYIWDTPVVAEDFYGSGNCPGTCIRTGTNTRQFCGDSNGGCYGEVHADGEVIMGALWKVRRNLNTTLGNSAGDAVANTLFVNWMNAYNDSQIRTVIESHWLTLDDNDGNVGNGTPNYNDIDSAFREQGFPGVDLQLIQITHTPLGNTTNQAGPYVVTAQVSSLIGATITGAQVHYQVNNGSFVTVNMTHGAGTTWTGNIPGQTSPSLVDYYISASDNLGNSDRLPETTEFSFYVGILTTLYFNDFEGSTDEGWAHAVVSTQDDWQRGTPAGKSGTSYGVAWRDPSAAYAGSKCWGNDLGNGSEGAYSANVNNHLDSPVINCNAKSLVRLRYQRWLGVEESIYDHARIYVRKNGLWYKVYDSPSSDLSEMAWSQQEVDLSTYADNNATMQVRFELTSDGGKEFGGWNLDNVEILYVAPASTTDTIVLTGSTSGTVGGTVNYSFSNAPASAPYWIYYAFSRTGTTINGQLFDIGTPYYTATTGTTTALGTASWTSGPIPTRGAGRTVYVEARADGVQTFDSNTVTLVIQ